MDNRFTRRQSDRNNGKTHRLNPQGNETQMKHIIARGKTQEDKTGTSKIKLGQTMTEKSKSACKKSNFYSTVVTLK